MVTERYHGSVAKAAVYDLWRPVRDGIGAFLRRHFRRPVDQVPPRVEELLDQAERFCDERDWAAALACAREAASIVEADGRPRAKRLVGNRLLPLGDCGRALRLLAEPVKFSMATEWNGESLAGRRLFIRQLHTTNMGAPIRMARFVAGALQQTDRCVVIVEPRLVPLFRRTFPPIEVRPTGLMSMADARRNDFVTSFEGLGGFLVSDWTSVASTFLPLRADESRATELRKRYLSRVQGPLVGISWGSTNELKEVPELAIWARFIETFPANFLSLQYGSIANALKLLRGGDDERLRYDPSVDQLVDMDRFASQVAAVDAIVTISNTGAHLAGAMGKPTVVVIDDRVGRGYPAYGERSWWYPSTTLVRRRGREWQEVMEEARSRLSGVLG